MSRLAKRRTDLVSRATQFWVALALAISVGNLCAASVAGTVTEFRSENDLVEQCIRLADFPKAHYSRHDREQEDTYCELDFTRLALCPKLWSTSPGTILYEIDASVYGGNYEAFERQHCAEGHHARQAALHKPAVFKVSINGRDSSATFAPSDWVYYHLSRYFRTQVHVPAVVYRTLDARFHNQRVTRPALAIVANRHNLRMLGAGWRLLDAVETGGETGPAASAALTDDGRQLFGVLVDNQGERYGAEFNGTRESGWGVGQNEDFQQTAPFIALRDPLPVAQAARAAIHEARKNPRMAKELSPDTPIEQVVFWMKDITEITLLDYILDQQDRIGNIDYNWRWYWIEEGKLESKAAHDKEVPADLAEFRPVRLRQSAINDNDAGVRMGYANFTAKTHMLEGLRHYNADLYRRLGLLATDFDGNGPARHWLSEIAGLSDKEAGIIAANTVKAFTLLQTDCRSGALKLDLDPVQLLAGNSTADGMAVSCEVEDR